MTVEFATKTADMLREKLRASMLVLCFPRLSKLALEQQSNKEWRTCLQRWAWYGTPDSPLVLIGRGRNPEAPGCLMECEPCMLAVTLLEAKIGQAGYEIESLGS